MLGGVGLIGYWGLKIDCWRRKGGGGDGWRRWGGGGGGGGGGGLEEVTKNFGFSPVPTAMNMLFFFPPNYANSRHRLQIWNLKFWGSILMTEMESPLENYADGLRFHFDGYEICRLLYRWVGDALTFIVRRDPL